MIQKYVEGLLEVDFVGQIDLTVVNDGGSVLLDKGFDEMIVNGRAGHVGLRVAFLFDTDEKDGETSVLTLAVVQGVFVPLFQILKRFFIIQVEGQQNALGLPIVALCQASKSLLI